MTDQPGGRRLEYSVAMGRLRSPWWLMLAFAVALAAWAFTIGPWGPWHWRTAGAERFILHGRPGHYHTRVDGDVTLRGGRLRLRIAAAPLPRHTGAATTDFFADVRWWVVVPRTRTVESHPIARGAEGLWGPHRTALVELDPVEGRPHGLAHLGVRAAASSRAVVSVTLLETADVVRGFPVVGIIVFVWLVVFAARSVRVAGRAQRSRSALVTSTHREA